MRLQSRCRPDWTYFWWLWGRRGAQLHSGCILSPDVGPRFLHFALSVPYGVPPAEPTPSSAVTAWLPLPQLPAPPHPHVCWARFCFLKISVVRLILLGWSAVISLSQCPNLNFGCKVPSVLSWHIHKFLGLRHMHLGGVGANLPTFPQIEILILLFSSWMGKKKRKYQFANFLLCIHLILYKREYLKLN